MRTIGLVLVLLSAALGSEVSAQNPRPDALRAADLSLRLEGRLERVGSGQPIANARVLLVGMAREVGPPDTTRTARDGTFAFDSLSPGRYVLRTFALGFQSRADTVALTNWPGLRLTVALVPRPLRLGRAASLRLIDLTSSVRNHSVALALTATRAKPAKAGDAKPRVLVSSATPLHL